MNPENDTPKIENCSRIIREFLKDYSRSPTRIRRKWFCIPKIVAWNPIIRLSNCKIIQRTRKSKMKHTTPTTVLFFNLTEFPITISVTSIATNVNGCGIGVMGNTLTMDMDKTENKIQTVHVYPYASEDDDTCDYFSSDNSMTNSKTEREKIHKLLQDQKDIFWTGDKELEKKIIMRDIYGEKYDKYNNNKKKSMNPLFHYLMEYRMNKIENAIQRRQEKGLIVESPTQRQLRLKNSIIVESSTEREGPQNDEEMKEFWSDKKLKIGTINRNLRLSSAMIDPCSHRYYLSIRIHDTDKGRLIMKDNIHRTNYDIIIRHEDIERPPDKRLLYGSFEKMETAP